MLVVIERKKGEQHPTNYYWATTVTGQTRENTIQMAKDWATAYNTSLEAGPVDHKKKWLIDNMQKTNGRTLVQDAVFVINHEWTENEFGLEMP